MPKGKPKKTRKELRLLLRKELGRRTADEILRKIDRMVKQDKSSVVIKRMFQAELNKRMKESVSMFASWIDIGVG